MREKLNENPAAQVAVVALLLVVAAVFLLGKMGGGSEEEGEEGGAPTPAAASAIATAEAGPSSQLPQLPAPGSGPGAPPPLPRAVIAAFDSDQTVALLFVRVGGIDDRLTKAAATRLGGMSGVASFTVPVDKIARYASVAQGVNLNRVPALVVIRPRRLSNGVPTASVRYGFQSPESVVQAVVDAGYRGPTLSYHP
jgi:hypothetical protein